jgi:phosphatidylinositol-bisphosphatase
MIDLAITDLNYRIDLADGDVRELLASSPGTDNIPILLKHDQVR